MSMTHAPDRYTVLPDEETLMATVVALEEHGFSVEVVPDLDAARDTVLARILDGGPQKLVPNRGAARKRIFEHSLQLEDARALVAYGQNSRVAKVLEIHQEDPGRIHVVLIRQVVGF